MSAAKEGKPLVIVYHADCVDGAACAWGVAKAHGVDKEPEKQKNVTYIPYGHHNQQSAEDQIRAALKEEATLYFVDVAPKKPFLDELMTPDANGRAKARLISVIDHHESEIKDLAGYSPPDVAGPQPGLAIHLDPHARSAAKLVWEDLNPGVRMPEVLEVIDRMDGAATGLVTPSDFAAAAYVDAQDIKTPTSAFDTLRGLALSTFNQISAAGRDTLLDQKLKIEKAMENLSIIKLQLLPNQLDVPVAIVNADVKQLGRAISQRLVDEGNKAGSGVAMAWYMQKNGAVTMSIRTDGNPDASKIAEHLRITMGVTGGGHDKAAAVHFKSLFEFARNMPFIYAQPPKPPGIGPAPGTAAGAAPPPTLH